MNTKNRPTSVTVIAWILIVISSMSLISTTVMLLRNDSLTRELMELNLMPITVQYVIAYLGVVIILISGIGMLKGKNWAKFLYMIWGAIGIVIGLITSPMKTAMIPGIVVFIVIVFLLNRPHVNKYFNQL